MKVLLCAMVQCILVYHCASSVPSQLSEADSILYKRLDNISAQLETNKELLDKIEEMQQLLAILQAEETNVDGPFFRNIRGFLLVERFNSGGKWSLLKLGLLSIVGTASSAYQQLKDLPGDDALPMNDIVSNSYMQLLEVLLDYGLYIDTVTSDSSHNTFLHLAALYRNTDMALLLLERGANVSATGIVGDTPLFLVAFVDSLDVIKELVKYKADINAVNDDGDTGLHYAAQGGFMDVVRYLVDSGANIKLVDKNNLTALDVAIKAGQKEVAAYLSCFDSTSFAHS